MAGPRARLQQVALRPDRGRKRGDELFPDGVQRRVGDLGKKLAEIVVKKAGPARKHGQGRVVAHGSDRLRAVSHHRLEDEADFLLGVAELALEADQPRVLRGQRPAHAAGPRGRSGRAASQAPYGCSAARPSLTSSSSTIRPAAVSTRNIRPGWIRPRSTTLDGGHVEHAHLGGHDDDVVVGDPVAQRPETVAVELRADQGAVGERDRRRAVPRLHEQEWNW